MPSENRDIRLQALNLGGTNIPLGGEASGISARISLGEVGAVARGVRTSIKTLPGQLSGTLTISLYPEDDAYPVLRNLYNARSGVPGGSAPQLPGNAVVAGGDNATWQDAHFTQVPDMILGAGTEVQTFVLDLVDCTIVGT